MANDAKVDLITVYEVLGARDPNDDRGLCDRVVAYLLDQTEALKVAEGQGAFGSMGRVVPREALRVRYTATGYGPLVGREPTIYLGPPIEAGRTAAESAVMRVRESALAKLRRADLTDAEAAALGIRR